MYKCGQHDEVSHIRISLLLSKRTDVEDFMGQIGVERTSYVGPDARTDA